MGQTITEHQHDDLQLPRHVGEPRKDQQTMSVRAKFRVNNVTQNGPGKSIQLHPVYAGSEENKAFFAATPGGDINIYCMNEAASAQFALGKEFYVDFTEAAPAVEG